MEGMHLITDLLQENDYLIKTDLKGTYFSMPLGKYSLIIKSRPVIMKISTCHYQNL